MAQWAPADTLCLPDTCPHLSLLPVNPPPPPTQGMKGWVFLLPTVTKEDAEAYFPEHKVCQVPSGQGESSGRMYAGCVLPNGNAIMFCD